MTFKGFRVLQHNIQNVQNISQNYSTCKELGKCGPFPREKTINRCHPQDGSDVEIIKDIKVAIITIFLEEKVKHTR